MTATALRPRNLSSGNCLYTARRDARIASGISATHTCGTPVRSELKITAMPPGATAGCGCDHPGWLLLDPEEQSFAIFFVRALMSQSPLSGQFESETIHSPVASHPGCQKYGGPSAIVSTCSSWISCPGPFTATTSPSQTSIRGVPKMHAV